MKSWGLVGLMVVFGMILAVPAVAEESWGEFLELKRRAEQPPPWMEVDRPKVLTVDEVVKALTGARREINLGPYVYFEYGLPVIRRESRGNLDVLARALKEIGDDVYVDGHCCAIGTDRNNCRLSWARSSEVVYELEALGIGRSRLKPRGFGERCPLFQNDTEENRRMNRRVVLVMRDADPNPCQQEALCDRWRYRSSREDSSGYHDYPDRPRRSRDYDDRDDRDRRYRDYDDRDRR